MEGKTNSVGNYRIFDYYSDTVHYFNGDGSSVSGMNREHTVPQSWWGKGTNDPWGSDLYQVLPSDSKANGAKNNYPLGKVAGSTSYSNQRMKTGKDASGRMVFEPCDEYKGDFARIYFYVATCYPDIWEEDYNYAMKNEDYPTLKPWIVDMLLQWHEQDPVSEWEMKRLGRVYRVQKNRNPFVDYPDLAEHIWGNTQTIPFDLASATLHTLNSDDYFDGVVYQTSFNGVTGGFTIKNVKAPSASTNIWKLDTQYECYKASGFISGSAKESESWLISPAIELPTETALLCFDHAFKFGQRSDLSVHISTDKQSWTELTVPKWPSGANYNFVSSGDVNLSQYAGMTVYLAFKYTSTTAGAATWEIKNVMVTGSGKLNKETDGINDVELASTPLTAHSSISYPTGIYTITGQRISVPVRSGLPHGVYIINGKKVFVNK